VSGNRIGGLKVRTKLLAKDPDYYKKIALKSQDAWVRNGKRPRGFACDPERAKVAGAIGGAKSRRKKRV
jgi:uncharacterized protein